MTRDERIAALIPNLIAREAAVRDRERAARMKASGGLPLPAMRAKGGGSIANRSPGRRTTGKHRAN